MTFGPQSAATPKSCAGLEREHGSARLGTCEAGVRPPNRANVSPCSADQTGQPRDELQHDAGEWRARVRRPAVHRPDG